MNINQLIDRVKKKIGLNGILKDIYNDQVIYDSIINVSLNTLNNLHGFTLKGQLDSFVSSWGINLTSADAKFVNNSPSAYGVANSNDAIMTLPKDLTERLESLGSEIRKVYITTASKPVYMTQYAMDIREELMGINRNMNFRRNYVKPTVQFKKPNFILLKNYVSSGRFYRLSGFDLYIQCTHPKNLSTISRGIAEFFENLCIYDLMINIYNNELSLLNVDLGNSRVETQLEQFTNASANREALIEKFREKTAYDEITIF